MAGLQSQHPRTTLTTTVADALSVGLGSRGQSEMPFDNAIETTKQYFMQVGYHTKVYCFDFDSRQQDYSTPHNNDWSAYTHRGNDQSLTASC
jgi:hypothetical protein